MGKHTEGPWFWENGALVSEKFVVHSQNHEASRGDKELIAAAPDLLEALTEMIQAHNSALRTGHERIIELGGDCNPPEMMIAIAKEIKAITSAKGGST